jgi:hypothetical protein
MNVLIKLQNIDRRILYVLVAIVLSVPVIIRPSKHPDFVFPEVQHAYDVIDHVKPGHIVLLSTSWGAGTKAENEPQMQALMRHMFAKHIKFAVMSWDPAGDEITFQSGDQVQKDMHATYGKDWVHLGYKTGATNAIISGLAENFPAVMKQDRNGTPLSQLSAVSYVKNYKQIGAVVDITSVGLMGYWIAYLTTPKHIPLIYAPTAVMSASAYPYLDSGQLKGMLNGVMGAVQYETLIGRSNVATDASATSWALSAAHIYIILLIIIGNLGYLAAKKAGVGTGGSRLG